MLRLTTFGGLSLARDGEPVLGPAGQRARLAFLTLLASGGAQGIVREKLILLLWPEVTDEKARSALKQATYEVRRGLGDDAVILGTTSLSLNPELITSDLRDFENAGEVGDLAAMATLYQGPFLDGVHIRDAVDFDQWSSEMRTRLAFDWARAVEQLAADAESRHAWKDASRHRRALATAEPLNGRYAAALMRAMAEDGNVHGAISHFRIHEALLDGEVGARPEAEVAALARALSDGRWERMPAPLAEEAIASLPAVEMAVEPTASPVAAATVDEAAAPVPASVTTTTDTTPRRGRRRPLLYATAVIGLTALATAAWSGVASARIGALSTLMSRSRARIVPRSIVVATFENETNDPALEMFGKQAADWLGRALADADFRVVDPRTTHAGETMVRKIPRPLRNADLAIALAEETSAAYVLVGSYYRDRDSLEVNTTVVDAATGVHVKSFGPFKGPRGAPDALLQRIVPAMLLYLRSTVDSSAGGMLASRLAPPSLEAFRQLGHAWERYFASPGDTARLFAELDSAAAADSSYAAPLLMKAYALDVAEQWPAVAALTARARRLEPSMTRLEKASLELFEADLAGDGMKRLRAARAIAALSPGSTEMPVLVAVSAMYLGRVDEARAALREADPDRGMNLEVPTYWEWRTAAEHAAGAVGREMEAVEAMERRFPRERVTRLARIRVLAATDDRALGRWLRDESVEGLLFAAEELRAHGHAARADSIVGVLAARVPVSMTADASRDEVWRAAAVLYEARRYERARVLYEQMVARDSMDVDAVGRLAVTAARLRDSVTAGRLEARLSGMESPFVRGKALRWQATLAAHGGERERAEDLLRRAVGEGFRLKDSPTRLTVHLDVDWMSVFQGT